MTILKNRAEMAVLIQSPAFQELLEIHTPEAFLDRCLKYPNQQFEYHANKWDEEGSGVKLFKTPRRADNCGEKYGTWLSVSRLYGNPELPFRVQAAEYVPWGIEIDLHDLGDFKTLGEALDLAFIAHEQGKIALNVSGLDMQTGKYVQCEPQITIPDIEEMSGEAQLVNFVMDDLAARRQERLAMQQGQVKAKNQRYQVIADSSRGVSGFGL